MSCHKIFFMLTVMICKHYESCLRNIFINHILHDDMHNIQSKGKAGRGGGSGKSGGASKSGGKSGKNPH